jgi:hypothetical protein
MTVTETKQRLNLNKVKEYAGCAFRYSNHQNILALTKPILVKSLSNELLKKYVKFETPVVHGMIANVSKIRTT